MTTSTDSRGPVSADTGARRGLAERVQLGRSPAHVSRVIFGSMAIGSARHDPGRRIRTIRAAVDAGSTTIDSAPMYDLGVCDQAVGKAIRDVSDRVQILSKVGLRWDDPYGKVLFWTRDQQGRKVAVRRNSRPESVRLEVERSLQRLGVETFEAVHVHIRDEQTPIEETMGALKDLLHQGKLRAIGLSTNFGPHDVAAAQRALDDVPLASLQIGYNLIERGCEADLLPLARDCSIGVLARSPLAMGLLTGKLTLSSGFAEGDFRAGVPAFHRDNIRRIATALQHGLRPVAARHGVSIAAVALAWVLSRPEVSAVVVGASHPRQARANAASADLELGAEDERDIQRAFDGLILDPNAGVSLARRSLSQGRRIVRAVGRRLGRCGFRRVGSCLT